MHASDTQPLPLHPAISARLHAQTVEPPLMEVLAAQLRAVDRAVFSWMQAYGDHCLRGSLALVFIWFGALKVVGMSPAADLVAQTVFWWDASWFLPVLGLAECAIGLCFLHPQTIRLGIALMACQMVGTFFPFVVLPQLTYTSTLLTPTMEGQYIVKNFVLIAAAIAIGSRLPAPAEQGEG